MTDMRRTLLWVVFTMSLVLLWDAWSRHTGQPTLFGSPAARPAASAPAASATAGTVPAPAAVATPGVAAVAATAASAPAAAQTPTVQIDTDVMRVQLDARGGDLVGLDVLPYADTADPMHAVRLFDRSATRTYVAQSGLIGSQAGAAALPNHLTPMRVVDGPRRLADGQRELSVRFESAESGGVKLAKTYTFARGSYRVAVRHEIVNVGAAPVQPQLYLQLLRDGSAPAGESSFYSTFTGPAMYTDAGKFRKIAFADIEKGKADHEQAATDGWIAMVQHYFASAWMVPAGTPREFRTAKVGPNLYSIALVQPLGAVEPGATRVHEATLYAGPQEENALEALAPGLSLVKDYGWLKIIAQPLFWLLDKLHGLLGNWGWAIVALVVLLKAAFYWLNASAYRSMAKMKAVNPRVMELRERHKDDPQRMQQEMMRIYREEKVNPLGGCLPILVQMPFFIALYWVLLSSVEMRNAPWLGWIRDLAAPDPYYILPLLMTASTLFQTWLNPAPPDPVQAKMMWIMPLLFSVMFFFFPSGLVLYWLTNNLLSIAQQWFINRRLGVGR